MSAIAITGQDTIVLNDHLFTDFADADCGKLEYDEDLTKLKVGKDGNGVFGLNQGGRAGTLTMRIILGQRDDKYLNGLISEYLLSPSDYVLDVGSFFKRTGDGAGNVNTVLYSLIGGAPRKQPMGKMNTDGDPSQAVGEWTWYFLQVPRSVI